MLLAAPAYAQAAGAAGPGGLGDILANPLFMLVPMGLLLYFLILRPQQQRIKQHQATIAAIKRGDSVVLSSGVIGKVVRVEDAEVGLEIATGVTVKVRKGMISEVQARGAPAPANDAKT
jgi:preprotein translocase subunit YajC